MVECAGLEIQYTVLPYRGFESLPFRQKHSNASMIEPPLGGFVISGDAFPFLDVAICHRPVTPFRYPFQICPDGHNARQEIL